MPPGCCSYNNVACELLSIQPNVTRPWLSVDWISADAALVFAWITLEVEDSRKKYGEPRIICYDYLEKRLVVVGYTR